MSTNTTIKEAMAEERAPVEAGMYWGKRSESQDWELVDVRKYGEHKPEVFTMGWDISDPISSWPILVPANLITPDGEVYK